MPRVPCGPASAPNRASPRGLQTHSEQYIQDLLGLGAETLPQPLEGFFVVRVTVVGERFELVAAQQFGALAAVLLVFLVHAAEHDLAVV